MTVMPLPVPVLPDPSSMALPDWPVFSLRGIFGQPEARLWASLRGGLSLALPVRSPSLRWGVLPSRTIPDPQSRTSVHGTSVSGYPWASESATPVSGQSDQGSTYLQMSQLPRPKTAIAGSEARSLSMTSSSGSSGSGPVGRPPSNSGPGA